VAAWNPLGTGFVISGSSAAISAYSVSGSGAGATIAFVGGAFAVNPPTGPNYMAFSPNGGWLVVTTSANPSVEIFPVTGNSYGTPTALDSTAADGPLQAAFSPDSTVLVAATQKAGSCFSAWATTNGAPLTVPAPSPACIGAAAGVAFEPGPTPTANVMVGNYIASGTTSEYAIYSISGSGAGATFTLQSGAAQGTASCGGVGCYVVFAGTANFGALSGTGAIQWYSLSGTTATFLFTQTIPDNPSGPYEGAVTAGADFAAWVAGGGNPTFEWFSVSGATPPAFTPAAPVLAGSFTPCKSEGLSWNTPSPGPILAYNISRVSNLGLNISVSLPGASNAYVDEIPPLHAAIHWSISAENAAGWSASSNVITFTPANATLGGPCGLLVGGDENALGTAMGIPGGSVPTLVGIMLILTLIIVGYGLAGTGGALGFGAGGMVFAFAFALVQSWLIAFALAILAAGFVMGVAGAAGKGAFREARSSAVRGVSQGFLERTGVRRSAAEREMARVARMQAREAEREARAEAREAKKREMFRGG
jgi:WD40 repeat protein